jgi:hypothetical protein
MKLGDRVETLYGTGTIRSYRESDAIYTIELVGSNPNKNHNNSKMWLYGSKQVFRTGNNDETTEFQKLEQAYKNLEDMRKLNLEIACQEAGILVCDFDMCSACLLSNPNPPNKKKRFASKAVAPPPSCLTCGTPVCKNHSSPAFRRENISLCLSCESLFGMSFIERVLTASSDKERRKLVDQLMEVYDRALLMLRYTTQYVESVAEALEQSQKRQHRVGLGTSSAGIVSGVLGIVSAATILTPVGPPLLIASFVFGGTATLSQTGSEIKHHYFSEPKRIADQIFGIHGVLVNILRIASAIRDAVLRDHVRSDLYNPKANNLLLVNTNNNNEQNGLEEVLAKNSTTILASATTIGSVTTIGAGSMAAAAGFEGAMGAEASIMASNARFFSRGSTAAMQSLTLARFAGGTLAACTIVLEAKSLKDTLQSMQQGSPCEKAQKLREIGASLDQFPTTQALDAECDNYLKALTHRIRAITREEVVKLLLLEQQELDLLETDAEEKPTVNEKTMSESSSSMTLLERIERYKQRRSKSSVSSNDEGSTSSPIITRTTTESAPSLPSADSSLLKRIEMHKKRTESPSRVGLESSSKLAMELMSL